MPRSAFSRTTTQTCAVLLAVLLSGLEPPTVAVLVNLLFWLMLPLQSDGCVGTTT